MFHMTLKEWTIAAMAGLGVYSFYWMSGAWKSPAAMVEANESYEMPRPREAARTVFDLSGREVQTRVVGQRTAPAANVLPAAPAKPAVIQNPNANKAKPVDAKKKAQEAAAKKKAQAAAEAKRKKALLVRTVGPDRTGLSGDSPQARPAPMPVSGLVSAPAPKIDNVAAAGGNDDKDEGISPGLWLSRMQSNPNQYKAAFVAAKTNIGDRYYYDILLKLLKDNQQDRFKAALEILANDSSVETFAFLVKLPDDVRRTVNLKSDLDRIYTSFASKPKLATLARALESSDKQIVIAAEELVHLAISNLTAARTQPPPRATSAAATLSQNDFNIFKLALTRLRKSQDQVIARNAQALYGSLWQVPIVAEN